MADDFASAYSDTINEAPTRSQNWLEDAAERHADMVNNLVSRGETLQVHLEEQLRWYDFSSEMHEMILRLINNLDSNGYLSCPLEELLIHPSDKEELELAQRALKVVQKFDPEGVGARDLRECLLLQIPAGAPHEKELKRIIRDHLEDLEKNSFPQISKATGYSFSLIQELLDELRRLNPRPGSIYADLENRPIIPDVIVDELEDGALAVHLPDSPGTSLRINPYYQDLLKEKGTDKETKKYLRDNLGEAKWLIDAVRQRKLTLMRVTQEIVNYQKDFFIHGPHAIKPLKLQQIADRLQVHITTVSRACDGKWIQTPQGIYPLKRFFTGSLSSSSSSDEEEQDTVAQAAARSKLREIIDAEDKKKPLSDEEIVILMEKAGIKLSRRTVTKYRAALNIPGSRQRKAWTE